MRLPPTLDRDAMILRNRRGIGAFRVEHLHPFGTCSGTLAVGPGVVEYRTNVRAHAMRADLALLELVTSGDLITIREAGSGRRAWGFRATGAEAAEGFRRMWERSGGAVR